MVGVWRGLDLFAPHFLDSSISSRPILETPSLLLLDGNDVSMAIVAPMGPRPLFFPTFSAGKLGFFIRFLPHCNIITMICFLLYYSMQY